MTISKLIKNNYGTTKYNVPDNLIISSDFGKIRGLRR